MSRLTLIGVSQNPVDAGLAKTELFGNAGLGGQLQGCQAQHPRRAARLKWVYAPCTCPQPWRGLRLTLALQHHLPLELRHATQHDQHQLARGRVGVHP